MTPARVLLLYARASFNATLSYQHAWPREFAAHPRFACTHINLGDRRLSSRLRAHVVARGWSGDAVVMLHSVFSNGRLLAGRLFDAVRRLPQPKAFFIGNEYKLMPEKMQFCEELPVALLVSQTGSPDIHRLYRERLGCAVVGIPYTGLEPGLFRPTVPLVERPIDLGYRAFEGAEYLGHRERSAIAEYFVSHASRLGLRVDISLNAGDRFDEEGWAGFLNRCRAQLGTESGTDYFDLCDRTRRAVNAYLSEHPGAPFEELERRFFEGHSNRYPFRVVSGRNIEAAGTGTVQLLFDGKYDGYFEPDIHYIPLRKDFSNVDEAMHKFRDDDFCRTLIENARRMALERLTYDRLLNRFADALAPLM